MPAFVAYLFVPPAPNPFPRLSGVDSERIQHLRGGIASQAKQSILRTGVVRRPRRTMQSVPSAHEAGSFCVVKC